MPTFISVLTADMGLSHWRAVLKADTLADLLTKLSFDPGIDDQFAKQPLDEVLAGSRKIINDQTGGEATVRNIQLSPAMNALMESMETSALSVAGKPRKSRKMPLEKILAKLRKRRRA